MGEPDRAQALSASACGPSARRREIAATFLRLGVLGFGGPVAVMAMMEEQVVRRRRWLTPDQFGEAYAICKLLPGPVATQMAIHLGRLRGGTLGGLIAGLSFVLPCFFLVLGLSVVYVDSGLMQGAGAVMSGLQAAALAIILVSTWGLARPFARKAPAWAIALASAVVVYARPGLEPLLILGFGVIGGWLARSRPSRFGAAVAWISAGGLLLGASALASRAFAAQPGAPFESAILRDLFWMCCKAGFFVFGTGLAVVPVLEADAVGRYHWLTHAQFMDGLAIGQVTPGPVVITATFIGFLAARLPGALAATFGMFLPAFFNTLVLVPRLWKRLSGTPAAKGFAELAIPAVIGGILGTTFRLGTMTLDRWQSVTIFLASLVAALWLDPPVWVLIPAAGLAGALLY